MYIYLYIYNNSNITIQHFKIIKNLNIKHKNINSIIQ